MGVEIEAQDHIEVMQVRSRELQLENTAKLEEMTPVIDTLADVDLQNIETTTNEIKDMIVTNIDEQVNLNEIIKAINKTTKSITEIKKSITRLNNTVKELTEKIDKLDGDTNG